MASTSFPPPRPPATNFKPKVEVAAVPVVGAPTPGPEQPTNWTELLARFRLLALYYQQCHWSSHGDDYFGDHLLLDRLYGEVSDEVDGIAEKGIGVTGDVSHVNLVTHLTTMLALSKGLPLAPNEDDVYFAGALAAEMELSDWLHDQYNHEPNIGVQNLLQGFVDAGSNRIYLLRRRLVPDTMD